MTETAFDVRDFRRTLGQFPTGVTVITARTESGEPIGVTASSFNSVSVDPPLILWSVDKGAYSAAVFENAEYFAVNVLAKEQVALSNRFAGRGEDKFAGVDYASGLGDSPLFDGCAAQFQCKTWNLYDGGDHIIVVGEVKDYQRNEAASPLVFSQGGYAVSVQHPSMVNKESMALDTDVFLSDYLLYLLRFSYTCYSSKLYPLLSENYGVSPGEWRVLTVLADKGSLSVEELALQATQPYVECLETVESLVANSTVSYTGNGGQVALTTQGKELCDKVRVLAKQQENEILQGVPGLDTAALKDGLRKIISALI